MDLINSLRALVAVAVIFYASCTQPEGSSAPSTPDALDPHLTLNQIQVIGTHNSYAQPIDSMVMATFGPILDTLLSARLAAMDEVRKAEYLEYHPNRVSIEEALSYTHPPLTDQLEAGMRSLEIDVYYDPSGGRFTQPATHRTLSKQPGTMLLSHDTTGLNTPGFKVLHIPDFDFRSHCPTLRQCLGELRDWSIDHPQHIPLFILMEIKQQSLSFLPEATQALPFDKRAMDALDAEILEVLGRDKIITPDDIRDTFPTLESAVLAGNYPTLKNSRGKFIFLMLPAIDEDAASAYWEGRPSLEGRVMFVRSSPGTPRSAFLLLDNAILRQEDIQKRVAEGYLVRTRADIETYEAKVNDPTRMNAAFTSGAHIISTDFIAAPNHYGTDYHVSLPSKAEAVRNPINGLLRGTKR
jgi:hypothetical protein